MNFGTMDLLVLLIYLGVVLAIGMSGSKFKDSKDFFLGGKKLPWYLIMFSIIATETSSLTFLDIPGLSYRTDFAFLQVAFGFIIGRIFVSYVILPIYFQQGYVSVYQWVGEHFGKKSQRYASSTFLITRVLGDGIRLYATSIPVNFILSSYLDTSYNDIYINILTLFTISFITILYTVIGGFRSVVLTDSLQFVVYLGGGIFSLFYIYFHLPGNNSFDSLISFGLEYNKLNIFHGFNGDFFKSPYFFVNGIFGGILITIGTHGVDQMFAQRLLACKSEKESRMALIGSGILVFFQFLLFLSIGFVLFANYKSNNIESGKVFSKYIVENIPSPVLGLIVAAILASAMSTLSSSINSLSLSFLVDWKNPHSTDADSGLKESKVMSFIWGIILFLSSLFPLFLSSQISSGLVELGLKISSFTLGPLIAIFLLGRFMNLENKINSSALGFSIVASVLSTMYFTYKFTPALTFIIPFGICSFYFYIFLSNVTRKVKMRT